MKLIQFCESGNPIEVVTHGDIFCDTRAGRFWLGIVMDDDSVRMYLPDNGTFTVS